MTDDELEGIVRAIYAAAADRAEAEPMFARIARAVRASSGWINDFSPDGVVPVVAGLNMNGEVAAPYAEHFVRVDPWVAHASDVKQGAALSLERFVTTSAFRRSEIYNDLLAPSNSDILHNMSIRFDYPDRFRGTTFFRGEGTAPFGPQEERILSAIAPHLRLLFRQWDDAPAAARRIAGFPTGLDAAFMLDRAGRVLEVNRAAAVLLARQGPLRIGPYQTLACAIAAEQAAMDGALRRCRAGRGGGIVRIHDAQRIAYRALIDPVQGAGAAGDVAILVTIRDAARAIAMQVDTAIRLFALSPSEAALATSLLGGRGLEEHAQLRGVTTETVRKQIAALFRKTGVRRQAALVALLFSLPT